ncbi:MBL fold metallo-hydrolase [Microlunatus elymi]|nr:MBL fold metallo-hydrolase [Microlunatus elymi]
MGENAENAAADPTGDSGRVGWRLGDWQQVAHGVYRLVAEPASVNIGLVVGSEGALLVDTGSSPAQGAELRGAVSRVTDLPLVAVVVTHDHFDHSFGLAGLAGVPSIGHESLSQTLLTEQGPTEGVAAGARSLGFDPGELVLPETLIAVADVVGLGGSRVAEIAHLGDGHSRGDLVITVTDPGADGFGGVIFAGDLIESAPAESPAPWYGSDSSPDQWSWTVDRLRGLAGSQTIIVPGHGDPVGVDFVIEQRDAIDAVRMELERLAAAGVSESDALGQGDWPFPADHVAAGIAPGYAEIRAAAERQSGAGGRPTLPLAGT